MQNPPAASPLAPSLLSGSRPIAEPALSRAARRAAGVYYTSPQLVSLVLDGVFDQATTTLRDSLPEFRVLDFACGAGEFLVQALQRLADLRGLSVARTAIFGLDIDPRAIASARARLCQIDEHFPIDHLKLGDALDNASFPAESFDLIVGNPPYVNVRQLARSLTAAAIDRLRATYQTARGNFDLYPLFIERAISLLRPGGRCALVIPNKWTTLDYARNCRELLLEQTSLDAVTDLTGTKAFVAAHVYPHILVFTKTRPTPTHTVCVRSPSPGTFHTLPQASLSPVHIRLSPALDVEAQIPTLPLGRVARLACGTAGYTARKLSQRLFEADQAAPAALPAAEFVTTSNIDRYAVHLGNVRYLNHTYTRPLLPLTIPELTGSKRRLFQEPKIIIAGMSRRLEAAWDASGLALGVQVFAACQCSLDPLYLLALLNSRVLTYLFVTRFAGKQLAGGYFSINKGQLAQLPIPCCDLPSARNLATELSARAAHWTPAQDQTIDNLVYQLFGLSDTQIAKVEQYFSSPARSAA